MFYVMLNHFMGRDAAATCERAAAYINQARAYLHMHARVLGAGREGR